MQDQGRQGPRRLAPAIATIRARCGVGKSKAYEILNSGKIDAYQLDGGTLVDLDSLDAYLDQLSRYRPGGSLRGQDGNLRRSKRQVCEAPWGSEIGDAVTTAYRLHLPIRLSGKCAALEVA